jgi:DNA-binding winged helix-turn-helix (wHTH) protein/TolB-like protein
MDEAALPTGSRALAHVAAGNLFATADRRSRAAFYPLQSRLGSRLASKPQIEDGLPEELVLGAWRVRLREGRLLAPGREIRLEPRVAALLAYLVRHQGRLVSKEELLSEVWSEAVVAPVALSRAISELRRSLEDDPRAPRYIETFPKRGYRLLSPADVPAPPQPDARGGRRLHLALAGSAALVVAVLSVASQLRRIPTPGGPPTIAITPFRDLGGDPEGIRFAAGLTEDLFTQLAQVDDVRAVTAGSGAAARTATLEGTVQRANGRLRVVARLVEHGSGAQLWSEAFDRAAEEPLRTQRELAIRVVHGFRIHGLRARGMLDAAATSPAGQEREPNQFALFRAGFAALARLDLKGTLTGQEAFERTLRIDPGFALGRSGLALALAMRTSLTGDPAHARRALQEARRAAAEAPDLAEAHHAIGRSHLVLREFTAALRADEEALRLRPAFLMPLWDRADVWTAQGRLDLALRALVDLESRDYRPWRGGVRAAIGSLLVDLGFDAEARSWLEAALYVEPQRAAAAEALARLDAYRGERALARRRLAEWVAADPGSRSARLQLARVALADGDPGEAQRQLEAALAQPGEPSEPRLLLAAALAGTGDAKRAGRLLGEVERLSRSALDAGSEWSRHLWNLAAVASLRGDREAAALAYRQAVEAGHRECRWDRLEPMFAGSRGRPGFDAALQRCEALVAAQRAAVTPTPPPEVPARLAGPSAP